jgi:type I site-specific restriction-modification system R (restriction) subunit
MSKLLENTVEQAAIQWLEDQGYRYIPGPEIERWSNKRVILYDALRQFLRQTYKDIPHLELEEAIIQFTHAEGQDLDYRNRDIHRKITMGIDISWKENEKDKAAHLYPIDFEHPENNDFLCVNQFSIEGKNQRRPDLIIFVNGLPLVLFEFKNMFDENATVEDAFNQIQHYKKDIPQLFDYNAITVISDGEETYHGMYSSGREWFTPWKSVDGRSIAEHEFPLKALIEGLFTKDRLINYIQNFIFHEDHSGKLIKKGAKYHQFFGIRFAVEATKKAIKPYGDGRIGVIWHTQGSGKSISMAIYTGILRQLPELKNPTIVIQVDRNDLDTQLYDNFIFAKDIVGDIEHAESTDELRQLLDREAGGVIFTTIEKFRVKKSRKTLLQQINSLLDEGSQKRHTPNPSQEGNAEVEGRSDSPLEEGSQTKSPLEGGKGGFTPVNLTYFTSSEFLAYNPALKEKARALRNDSTLSEVLLWNELKKDRLGVDFHRQKPIGEYIVDFFCPELMLAIEIDGESHSIEGAEIKDKKRQKELEGAGIDFLRFDDLDVKKDINSVFRVIEHYVKENKIDTPSSRRAGLTPLKRGIYNRNKHLLEQGEIDHPILSKRENIIVIADEAHRTQYGFDTGGYAQNLRRALPKASFIGFTGTPVDKKDADTQVVFGETIHVYDIKQAVEDKATVPIYYEPRIVKLALKDPDVDLKAEEIVSELHEDTSNVKWAAIDDAAGADDRVINVAEDILDHFTLRNESLAGKAMIVCMSRRNCVKMYDAITQLPGCPEVAVVMTGNIGKDPESWNQHLRTKDAQEALKGRFKKPEDPLKIVIVRDMWLTGFDAPCLHTLYVDKIMHGHSLMQAIARVNRVFEDKPAGLVVDYIGIASRLRDATEKYTEGGGQGKPTFDTKEAAVYCMDQFELVKPLLGKIPWNDLETMRESEELLVAREAVNYILRDDDSTEHFLKEERKLSELFVMAKTERIIWNIMDHIAFIQSVRKSVRKIKYPTGTRKKTEAAIHDLIAQSISSNKIINVMGEMDVERMDISILDDKFLATAKQAVDGANIRIELMRRILMDELKVKMPKNIKRYGSLKEQIEEVIEQYHKHAIDSLTVITELMKRARELQEEDQRVKELGLSEEELAFYDILSKKEGIIREEGIMKDIVHKVTKAVKSNLQLDWYKKEDAKAAIRLAVKKELRGKVDIKLLNNILAEILEQAEGQYSDWPRVG